MPTRYTNIQTLVNLSPDGRLTFPFLKTVKYPEIPENVNDIYAITTVGDRLDLLAQQFYSDTNLYWVIACANPDKIQFDSLFIPEGTELRIPTDISSILSSYNLLNSF